MSFLRCLSVLRDFSCCSNLGMRKCTRHRTDIAYRSQPPPDGTSTLRSEVEGKVLFVLVEVTEVLTLFVVRDCQDTSDRLANGVARIPRSIELHRFHKQATHILVNFDAEPPAIFCTRRVRSSVFSSESCFVKSFLDLLAVYDQHRSCIWRPF